MKKMLTALAISLSALLTTALVYADPKEQRFDSPRDQKNYQKSQDQYSQPTERSEKRRAREENGVKRLHQMRWQPGYVMPQHYRGNSYKVEYKDFNLPKPSSNQQWYKVNKDYLLVDAESNNIIKIVSH